MTAGAPASLGSGVPIYRSACLSGVFPQPSLKVQEAHTKNPEPRVLVLTGSPTHERQKEGSMAGPPFPLSISRSVWFLKFLP